MLGKKWWESKTLIFNIIMVIMYGAMYVLHPKPNTLQLETMIAATTAITNIFLRLLTDKPIK